MAATELDTFVQKFYQLWHAGLNAHLDVKTHAGNAWVSLNLNLGPAPGPLGPQHVNIHQPESCGGARLRRRRRRAAARRQAEVTVKNKAEKADLENVEVVTTALVKEVTDDVCEDRF